MLGLQLAAVLSERCTITSDHGHGSDIHTRLRYFLALGSRVEVTSRPSSLIWGDKSTLVSSLGILDRKSRSAMSCCLSSGTYRHHPVLIRQKCRATIKGRWKSIKDTST